MRNLSSKLNLLMVAAALLFAGSARAQDVPATRSVGDTASPATGPGSLASGMSPATRLTIGIDAAFQLPVGDLANQTGVGFAGLVRGEYKLLTKLSATMRAGYLYSLKTSWGGLKRSIDDIPIWLGAKYFITDWFYGGAELGVNMIKAYYHLEIPGDVAMDGTSRQEKIGGDVGAGVLLLRLVDARVQFQILNFGHASDTMALMFSVGYNFLVL